MHTVRIYCFENILLLLLSQEKPLSIYSKLGTPGLQKPHNDPNTREVKTFVHMTVPLAFVPTPDVMMTFQRG